MSTNHSTWVVTTDSNTCRIYDYCKKPSHLTLIKEILHPENKLRDIDLTSDKPGHYKSRISSHGAYAPSSDPKEVKIEGFSREIAKELEHGRNTNSYQKLIVIAAPHMSGLLFQHLNKHVKNLITHNIEKDLLHLADHELLNYLREHAQYENE